ncbi:MAG: hypothetical protein Wins2KO_31290 [Winogradskyella sp.]
MYIENIEHFFLETPLYQKFDIDPDDGELLFDLIYFNDKIDCYCPFCDKDSTFIGTNKVPSFGGFKNDSFADMTRHSGYGIDYFLNKIHAIDLYCSRVEEHKMQIIVYITNSHIFKIGQFPSIAEISQPQLKKYRPVLTNEKYTELNRGVGLITHGVGIGAFVYLRRIFEDLIEEAHQILNKMDGWDEEVYTKARMNDKIEILKSELPEFLVDNKELYGILSKGIHELSEDECKEYFPTVKLGVELILDEKLEAKKKQDKIALAKKSIASIRRDIKDK